jgi:hypothetical protein
MDRTAPHAGGADRRAKAARDELAHRAALLYRLGFSVEDATARLRASVAWEHDHTPISDEAVGKIVHDTYARKPG